MANLGGKKTNGVLAWDFYIEKNPEWKKLILEVEYDQKNIPLLTKSGRQFIATKNILKGKDKLSLLSNKAQIVDGVRFAEVSTQKGKGFLKIIQIRKPTNIDTVKDEKVAMDEMNNLLKKIGHPITVQVKKGNTVLYEVKDIISCQNVDGTPKADFALVNKGKKPVFFISHKKEGGPSAFQQYSGITEKAGTVINSHKEVQRFLGFVAANITKEHLNYPMYYRIKDKKLINYAIYGPDFGKVFGTEHCQIIGQGKPVLNQVNGSTFLLTFDDHMSTSGDLSHFGGGYTPVLGATFRAGRGFTYQGTDYRGARVSIAPLALLSTRSEIKEIKF